MLAASNFGSIARLSRTSRAERVPTEVVAEFLASKYRLAGCITPLNAERDQIMKVEEADGRTAILRLSDPGESPGKIAIQNRALAAVRRADRELPVPQLIASVAGAETEFISFGGSTRAVRLFSFLEGDPVGRTERSSAQRAALARMLARLHRALAEMAEGGEIDPFPWNVLRSNDLFPLAVHINDDEWRHDVEGAFGRFCDGPAGTMRRLQFQYIHNDFNAKNVLVSRADPNVVSGIIDFGDMMFAPRIVDLGVAVARQVTLAAPLREAEEFVENYHTEHPLADDELSALASIVCIRLAMRIVIWSARARHSPAAAGSFFLEEAAMLLRTFLGIERWPGVGSGS